MAEHGANDESSIAPVSSLRSRFEQLTRAKTDLDVLSSRPASRKSSQHFESKPSLTLPRSRPVTPRSSITLGSRSLSGSTEALVRPTHEAPRARSPFAELANPIATSQLFDLDNAVVHDSAGAQPSTKPAIKPVVPPKKPSLARKLTVEPPTQTQNLTETKEPDHVEGEQDKSEDKVAPLRGRFSSDASWVERVQERRNTMESSASGLGSQEDLTLVSSHDVRGSMYNVFGNRPKRADSDASWVENLSATPPPATPREYRHDLSARGTFLRGVVERNASPDKSPSPRRRSPVKHSLERQDTFGLAQGKPAATEPPIVPVKKKLLPPSIPPPRRSVDRRPNLLEQEQVGSAGLHTAELTSTAEPIQSGAFPDATASNRRPPRYARSPWQISTGYDTRLVVSNDGLVCTSGFITKVWDVKSGKQLLDLPHQEALKVTAVAITSERSGPQLWLGTCVGDLHHIDIHTGDTIKTGHRAHRGHEIVRVFVQNDRVWSLDDSGDLIVWSADSLSQPLATHRVQRGHSSSLAHRGLLWLATGKDIRVYQPGVSTDNDFFLTQQPLSQPNVGNVSACTILPNQPNRIYFGHTDGKISIYDTEQLQSLGIVHVSLSKVSTMAGVGDHLWTGYGTGSIVIYDTAPSIWRVLKEWSAHDKQVCAIATDSSLFRDTGITRVISLAFDNSLKFWDGLLQNEWIEARLHAEDSRFSTFDEVKVSVLTWNAGASKPSHLQNMLSDEDQLVEYLRQCSTSDILVFGFQELVDLEDKKLTAKSIFKSKKKDVNDQEHIGHQYRAWRDYLSRLLYQRKGDQFILLHSASMIGLFSAVFVRAGLKSRVKHVNQAEVKRGMGGHYGNKGALVLRMIIDDSSVCFLNCHLAAGQTQTSSRNNDVAAILEADCFQAPMLNDVEPSDVFSGGGDGSMILDHEICILNGDLNYRIDTMSRETVIKHVQQGSIARLLDRDQLKLSRKKNPAFKLRVFNEDEIKFAPTYKYDVGTDIYDTSEKRRSPAWCDRVLYRGVGKIKCEEYRRWEVKISDHRPVSASFRCRIKRVDVARREKVMLECLDAFKAHRKTLQARSR